MTAVSMHSLCCKRWCGEVTAESFLRCNCQAKSQPQACSSESSRHGCRWSAYGIRWSA